jgi:hypothetical protein
MELKEFAIRFFETKQWDDVTSEDKDKWFFIMNRILSSKFPNQALFFNKPLDTATAMDCWFKVFEKTHSIPQWFWTGLTKIRGKKDPFKDLLKSKNIKPHPMILDLLNTQKDWE